MYINIETIISVKKKGIEYGKGMTLYVARQCYNIMAI